MNGNFGLTILRKISETPDYRVGAIVLNDKSKISANFYEKVISDPFVEKWKIPVFQYSTDLLANKDFRNILPDMSFGVSALFGHLLPHYFLNECKLRIVNLHPSLLPAGRGADPVAWAIIENSKQGVTIHNIDNGIDTGDILYQEELLTTFNQSSGEVYELALEALARLFVVFLAEWPQISIKDVSVMESSYHETRDLELLRESILENGEQIEQILRVILALDFNDGRRARIKISDGSTWDIRVKCERVVT
jgi:methionyl-tRNA formyltransferase